MGGTKVPLPNGLTLNLVPLWSAIKPHVEGHKTQTLKKRIIKDALFKGTLDNSSNIERQTSSAWFYKNI